MSGEGTNAQHVLRINVTYDFNSIRFVVVLAGSFPFVFASSFFLPRPYSLSAASFSSHFASLSLFVSSSSLSAFPSRVCPRFVAAVDVTFCSLLVLLGDLSLVTLTYDLDL